MPIFEHADWTISQTFVWICLRTPADLDRAAKLESLAEPERARQLGIISPVVTLLERTVAPELVISIDQADARLKELLNIGSLKCSGVRGTRQNLPDNAWSARRFLLASNRVTDVTSNEAWTDVLFRRADILNFWPSLTDAPSTGDRGPSTPGPKPGRPSLHDEWFDEALRQFRAAPAPDKLTAAEVARQIKMNRASEHKLNTIEKIVRPALRDFRKGKFPKNSGKSPAVQAGD